MFTTLFPKNKMGYLTNISIHSKNKYNKTSIHLPGLPILKGSFFTVLSLVTLFLFGLIYLILKMINH
jgi:hypothetical protein